MIRDDRMQIYILSVNSNLLLFMLYAIFDRKVNNVISGLIPIRIGGPTVPIPRLTYKY